MKRLLLALTTAAALGAAPLTASAAVAAAPPVTATVPTTSDTSVSTPQDLRERIARMPDVLTDRVARMQVAESDQTSQATTMAAAQTGRLFGANRYETAIKISQDTHQDPANDFGGVVFIANGMNFPDALAAGPAATSWFGPVLLVPPTGGLPASVRAEIQRLDAEIAVILGKTDNVTQQVENDLLAMLSPLPEMGSPVVRVAGDNRYQTSALLSTLVWDEVRLDDGTLGAVPPTTAYIANGLTYADALAGGAAGGFELAPLFLTAPGSLDPAVADMLTPTAPDEGDPADPEDDWPGQEFTTVRILGSPASVSTTVENAIRQILPNATIVRYSGTDRFDTARLLNTDVFGTPGVEVTMTHGYNFPDALAGAPRVNKTAGPTVLVRPTCVPSPTATTLDTVQPATITALGNTDQVSAAALAGVVCGSTQPPPTINEQAALQLANGFTVPTVSAARTTLNSLVVATPGSMVGYDRALFPHWRDADTWGWPSIPNTYCDVRQAALYREGKNVQYTSTCSITGGSWLDPFTAVTLYAPSDVDIDHIVPLAEAWRSGASSWSTTTRTQFANDKLVVVAVDDGANASKGDKAPDLWKPPNAAAHCLYAKRWTAIKKGYALTVSTPEKTALQTMLNTCPA